MRTTAGLAGPLLAVVLGGTIAGAPARAQDPPPSDPGPSTAMSHEARLDQAVRYFQLGERDEARRILASLVVSTGLSAQLRQDARVYLAEILLVDGDIEGARGFLRQVLREDPSYTVDPFRHTPEVAGEFDYVKALVTPVEPPEETPPPNNTVIVTMPLSVWSPFGRYHFAQGRPVRGLVYLSGVTSTAVVSGFLFGIVHGNREYLVSTTVGQTVDELDLRSTRRAQWVATGLFYGFWGASVIDAQVHWRKVGVKAAVQPTATADRDGTVHGGLQLRATF